MLGAASFDVLLLRLVLLLDRLSFRDSERPNESLRLSFGGGDDGGLTLAASKVVAVGVKVSASFLDGESGGVGGLPLALDEVGVAVGSGVLLAL